ncbi:MAG: mechanosensitive ion channel family protein [Gammaproteobacteria bacterium]
MMNRLAEQFGFTVLVEPWFLQAALVILATVLANLVLERVLRRARRARAGDPAAEPHPLLDAARRPLPALVWVIGISFAGGLLDQAPERGFARVLEPLRDVGVVACLGWFVIRLIRIARDRYIAARARLGLEVDATTVDAVAKLGTMTAFIVIALVIMQTLGFSVSGVLAAGGIGGIAIGFAAKDLLANFFGGLTIYLDRPFSVGEWIRSPDKDIEGTVEAISWRHTRIRAFNKNPIYVPNALFTTIIVENPSRMSHRRINETVGIRYEDLPKLATIVDDVKSMLRTHPEIDTTETLIVNFNQFAESSLDILVYTFTKTREWVHYHAVKQDVLLRIAAIVARHGAEIAFPTRTLHVAGDTPESAVLP